MRAGVLLGLGLGLTVGAALATGCAAGKEQNTTSNGGSGATGANGGNGGSGAGNGGNTTDPGGGGPGGNGQGGQGGFSACNKFTAEAEQAPAAMLIALDRSASMSTNGKWTASQLAVVGAIDKDVFDSMSLGLTTFPQTFVNAPQCLCDFVCSGLCDPSLGLTCEALIASYNNNNSGVACGIAGLPLVPIGPAGPKSNQGPGTRTTIYQTLSFTQPSNDAFDGSPVYDALVAGYAGLKLQSIDRRVLVLITDGGFSCTSLSGRSGYSDGACEDWELPDSVNALIAEARNDPEKPIFTFIIGVPGSNSNGSKINGYDTPPYNMQLALSTYAVTGSPDTVDPACSKDAVFTKNGAAPPLPCHFDLSSGASLNADALATAIQNIKGKALGCVYDLPLPPQGEVIDLDYVNVETTIDGTSAVVKKRSNPNDDCQSEGCWDYNAGNQVQLLGKTCDDLTKAQTAKVDIQVGCQTIVK